MGQLAGRGGGQEGGRVARLAGRWAAGLASAGAAGTRPLKSTRGSPSPLPQSRSRRGPRRGFRGLAPEARAGLRRQRPLRGACSAAAQYADARGGDTANPPAKNLHLRGFDSSRFLISRGGIRSSIRNFPKFQTQRFLVCGFLVCGLAVWELPAAWGCSACCPGQRSERAAKIAPPTPLAPRQLGSDGRGSRRGSEVHR